MDKNTLSHYGWIVIVIIIIAILITAATPFASLIKDGIGKNAQDFTSSAEGMLNNVLGGGSGIGSDVSGGGSSGGNGSDGGGAGGSGSEPGGSDSNENNEDDLALASPILALNNNVLIITKGSDKTEGYEIFIDGISQGTIGAVDPTEYDLSGFLEDSYEISVIARAAGMMDSNSASITYTSNKLIAPTLQLDGDVLVINTESVKTEYYEITVNGVNKSTVTASVLTQYNLSDLTEDTYEIVVVATADGMENSDQVSVSYNHNKLSAPVLSLNNDKLLITTISTKTETYELFLNDSSEGTFKADSYVECDLSRLTEGTYEITIVAKATGMEDSDPVSVAYIANKLNSPALSFDKDVYADYVLIIEPASNKTEMYEIFIDGTSMGTVSASNPTEYSLSYLTEGTYEISVIAKAVNMTNSEPASIVYESKKLPTPTLAIEGTNLIIKTDSANAELFVINVTFVYSNGSNSANTYDIPAGERVEFDISDWTENFYVIGVASYGSGYKSSNDAELLYKHTQLNKPSLSIKDGILTITSKSTKTEEYDIFIDGELVISKAYAQSVTHSLSELEEGSHEIVVVAKAEDWDDSDPVSISHNAKLIKPVLSLSGDMLTITTESIRTKSYEIFVDGTHKATITAKSSTKYDLSDLGLSSGKYTISVVATAPGFVNSESVSVQYRVSSSSGSSGSLLPVIVGGINKGLW